MEKFIEATHAVHDVDALVAIKHVTAICEAPQFSEHAVAVYTVDGTKYWVGGTLEGVRKEINGLLT